MNILSTNKLILIIFPSNSLLGAFRISTNHLKEIFFKHFSKTSKIVNLMIRVFKIISKYFLFAYFINS